MKIQYIVVSTLIAVFTVSFLFDVWTTHIDFLLGCYETNAFFAPFMSSPGLLIQAYAMSWFASVGSTVLVALAFRKYWYFGFSWYWLLIYWSIIHLQAGYHNLLIAGLC